MAMSNWLPIAIVVPAAIVWFWAFLSLFDDYFHGGDGE